MQGNKSQALVFKVMSFGKKSGEPKESKEEMLARKSEAKKKELEAKSEKLEKKKQLQIEKEAEKERRKAEAKAKKEEKEKKTLETTMAAKEKEESKHLCLCDEDLDMMGPSRSEILANAEEHQLPIVAYNNKRKFKDYTHSRDYGVAYNRDVEAYHYRGYDINPPIAGQDFGAVKESTKWVQYMSHAERHKRFYPYRMNYIPTDNSFVQLVLIIHLLACLFTLLCTICCKYIKQLHRLLAYEIIWLPGCIGVVFTSYMLLCSACSRKFPLNYTLLFINIVSMTYMCCYVTAYQDTFGVIVAVSCIAFIGLIFLVMSLCDVDFSKVAVVVGAAALGVIVPLILYAILGSTSYTKNWVPKMQRHYNMMIIGIATHSTSMILMLQLIVQNRTVLLPDDDYATGTFVVYMCEICMFMKLVSYMGLFEENHH
ncbi:uncharacterized protein LOC128680930 isoform X1 [Plodia interpunctella]|uniref:uncharacterized protein LOC128680930 isoform X1 n=1 Tax=Plodia interpunctella TaxID=58824 RepID=UPI0023674EBF|nr:uncharacterized protein LOC128680930 isoform X1 [Plodia interpunctella]